MPSLRELEKTAATLWLNCDARKWLTAPQEKTKPACLCDAPETVLQTIDKKGAELYGNLIAFGHHDVMESIYPYCRQLLQADWHDIVEDYLHRYPPAHYNFNRLCKRLPDYFRDFGATYRERYPFLPELADYEWIELEKMEQADDVVACSHTELVSLDQISSWRPVVNQTLTVRRYDYNIAAIVEQLEEARGDLESVNLSAVEAETSWVAIFRHPESQLCQFVELDEVTANLPDAARDAESYGELIPAFVAKKTDLHPQDAIAEFLELMESWQECGIFVGSRRKD